MKTYVLGFTGASGLQYGLRLLAFLLEQTSTKIQVVYSRAAQVVAQEELGLQWPSQASALEAHWHQLFNVDKTRLEVFGREAWHAPMASGSAKIDAMIICPCSMGAVAAIAHGNSDTLLERAADVMLKERRPLILVPRETPFSTLHLENLLKLSQMGCVILPPSPGFYHRPTTVEAMIDFVVARILDHLHIEHTLIQPWGQ